MLAGCSCLLHSLAHRGCGANSLCEVVLLFSCLFALALAFADDGSLLRGGFIMRASQLTVTTRAAFSLADLYHHLSKVLCAPAQIWVSPAGSMLPCNEKVWQATSFGRLNTIFVRCVQWLFIYRVHVVPGVESAQTNSTMPPAPPSVAPDVSAPAPPARLPSPPAGVLPEQEAAAPLPPFEPPLFPTDVP